MFLKHIIATALLTMTLALVSSAASVEKLGEPCRAFNVLSRQYVKDSTGKEWLALVSSNETTHCQLLLIDYATDEGRVFTAPAGAGAWSLNVVPGDRLVVGTYEDGAYMVFDLKQLAFTKTAKIEGEKYIWNSAVGSDGRLYGGTYPGAHLAALNLNTYQIEDLGCPAPPNQYMRNVSALPDGRIFCQSGMNKPARTIFDPKTGKFSPAPAQLAQTDTGVSFQGYFVTSPRWEGKNLKGAWVFDAKDLDSVEKPPFPTPPAEGGVWTIEGSTPEALLYRQGTTIWRCRAGAKELEKVFEGELKSGVVGQMPDGKLFYVRGQEYAVLLPGDTEVHLKPIPCEKSPRPAHWLRVDPQGRVWGGPQFGQTVFYFDPKSGETVNTGVVCDAGGEVYDGAFLNGKTYLVAYVGGDIIEFDPSQPWDQWHNTNPKTIHHLATEGYIRPLGGVQLGSDGKLYSSWNAKYGTYGGAIAITDPADGKTELIENPLGQQGVSAFALDESFIYAGTDLSANGLPNQKGASPSFGMIDRKTRQVAFQQAFEGASGIHRIFYDLSTNHVVLTVDQKIKFFDPARRQFLGDLGKDAPALTGGSLVGQGDGKAYYASERKILRLDIASGNTQGVAELPNKVDRIAIAPDGTIYATCGPALYRVKK